MTQHMLLVRRQLLQKFRRQLKPERLFHKRWEHKREDGKAKTGQHCIKRQQTWLQLSWRL